MIVQLLTSFTGALGFCLVFHLRQRYMFAASLGGLLTCGVYLAAASIWSGILLPTLTAAAFAALYAEFLAWFMGAPATLFLIPALLIPLVPGRPLYYAMYYAVQQDMDLSADFARQTALYALGIALGASLVRLPICAATLSKTVLEIESSKNPPLTKVSGGFLTYRFTIFARRRFSSVRSWVTKITGLVSAAAATHSTALRRFSSSSPVNGSSSATASDTASNARAKAKRRFMPPDHSRHRLARLPGQAQRREHGRRFRFLVVRPQHKPEISQGVQSL